MTDYLTMQARIANEISADGLVTEIKEAIQTAIQHYATHRFAFNQGELSFATVEGQSNYGASTQADIPNIVHIDAARVWSSGWSCPLTLATYEQIQGGLGHDDRGSPELIAYRDGEVWLAPKPIGGYTLTVAHVKTLGDLSADTDTNAWMTTAEKLIRSRAKSELFDNVLSQYDDADRMTMAELREYKNLKRARVQLADRAPARLSEVARITRNGSGYNIYGDSA